MKNFENKTNINADARFIKLYNQFKTDVRDAKHILRETKSLTKIENTVKAEITEKLNSYDFSVFNDYDLYFALDEFINFIKLNSDMYSNDYDKNTADGRNYRFYITILQLLHDFKNEKFKCISLIDEYNTLYYSIENGWNSFTYENNKNALTEVLNDIDEMIDICVNIKNFDALESYIINEIDHCKNHLWCDDAGYYTKIYKYLVYKFCYYFDHEVN